MLRQQILFEELVPSLTRIPQTKHEEEETSVKRYLPRIAKTFLAAGILIAAAPSNSVAAPILFSAFDSIQTTVDDFRNALGNPNNANNPGPLPGGRREINWDGGGSTATSPAPNPFAGFQNTRGALFTTPGTGFVQAPADGMATTFNNPNYSTFTTFSPVRLFSAVGSNITDATFTVPGSPTTPAFVRGFGVVFSDVDVMGSATLEFFDLSDNPLGSAFSAPAFDGGLSFLGVLFDAGEMIGRVRITSGNVAPGPDDSLTTDVVMMDDFIYGEPQAAAVAPIPEPSTLFLLSAGLVGLAAVRIRTKHKGRQA